MLDQQFKDTCKRLKPIIGAKADALWLAYTTAETLQERQRMYVGFQLPTKEQVWQFTRNQSTTRETIMKATTDGTDVTDGGEVQFVGVRGSGFWLTEWRPPLVSPIRPELRPTHCARKCWSGGFTLCSTHPSTAL